MRGFTAGRAREKIDEPALGFYQALVEARIPFEMVHDRCLDAKHLAPFRTLDPAQHCGAVRRHSAGSLRAFVERGGGLVATYETSLYDEWGVRRKDFGLSHRFSARSYAGRVEENMLNSYLDLKKDPATERIHPLLRGFEDAGRIINAVNQVDVTAADQSQFHSAAHRPDLSGSAHGVGFHAARRHHAPGVYLRTGWEGSRRLFPGDIDRTFWQVLMFDHGKLLRNAVEWATNEAISDVSRRQRHSGCRGLGAERIR